MHSPDTFDTPMDDVPTLLQCVQCGNPEPSSGNESCSVCGGELELPLPSTMDLGVDLDGLTEGADALSVHRVLAKYAQVCDVTFSLGQNELSAEQVFQPEAIMPVIALDALHIWQSIEKRAGQAGLDQDSLGVEFYPVEGGFFKYSAYAPAIGSDLSATLRMLVFLLAARRVLGMKQGERIDLAPRIVMWDKIDWDTDVLPQVLLTDDYDPMFHHREFPAGSDSKHTPQPAGQGSLEAPNPFASQG